MSDVTRPLRKLDNLCLRCIFFWHSIVKEMRANLKLKKRIIQKIFLPNTVLAIEIMVGKASEYKNNSAHGVKGIHINWCSLCLLKVFLPPTFVYTVQPQSVTVFKLRTIY